MDITLALGGGGARGFSHIGVLKVLEREGFRVRGVAGTSIGGIVGAGFAAGNTAADLEQHAALTPLAALLRARPVGAGLVGVSRIEKFLRELLGDLTFDQLPIPLAVTAVDLEGARQVVITEGPVVEAVLATIALPGIFPPQLIGGHSLVDGGTVDPVPVRAARALHPAPVLAVALTPPPERWAEERAPSILAGLPLMDVVARLRPGQALNVFVRSMEIAARSLTELHLERDQPEIVLRPQVSDIGLFDNTPAAEIIARGEAEAERALPALRALFTPGARLGRALRRRPGR